MVIRAFPARVGLNVNISTPPAPIPFPYCWNLEGACCFRVGPPRDTISQEYPVVGFDGSESLSAWFLLTVIVEPLSFSVIFTSA